MRGIYPDYTQIIPKIYPKNTQQIPIKKPHRIGRVLKSNYLFTYGVGSIGVPESSVGASQKNGGAVS